MRRLWGWGRLWRWVDGVALRLAAIVRRKRMAWRAKMDAKYGPTPWDK